MARDKNTGPGPPFAQYSCCAQWSSIFIVPLQRAMAATGARPGGASRPESHSKTRELRSPAKPHPRPSAEPVRGDPPPLLPVRLIHHTAHVRIQWL
jgi:hypothetical protein